MVQIETQNTNLADFSVSEIASAVKSILENQFAYIRVRGEISGYRGRHSSGHAYFGLKDQNARIDAVVWRASFSRLKVKPEDGLEVLATGRLSTFPGKSTYQLVVDWLEPAGVGALMALLEKRRRELAEEGLFDVSRKRPLPFLPRTIGVVTSPTGAVIRDILHRLADRFPTRVVVWPVRVQGEGSAEDLAAAIRGFGSVSLQKFVPRPDVLILARGGGSLEDLWSFNDETVVRAAAQSEIPIISAVGHETDWTLIDYVSDLRAPTPTAAAELCAPIRVEMLSRVEQVASRVLHATARQVLADKTRCRSALRALPPARFTLSAATQTLDSQTDAITATGRDYLRKRRLGLTQTAAMLERYSPNYQLVRWTERALSLRSKLNFFRDAVSSNASEKLKSAIDSFFFHMEWGERNCRERHAAVAQRWNTRVDSRQQNPVRLRRELTRAEAELRRTVGTLFRQRYVAVTGAAKIFAAVNYQSVLARGYALVLDGDGILLTSAAVAQTARRLKIRFVDGQLDATAASQARLKRRRVLSKAGEQDLLF